MRILLVSSAFSGLTQRFYTELSDAGFIVSVELHSGNIQLLIEGANLFKPDLIICPFLTKKLPAEIYQAYKCLIVHPGIKGDRGPSSLDWAIQSGVDEWGVTLLEAADEMDAGDIWASKTFAMRNATKSSIFYREVTQSAVDCLWEALSFFEAPHFKPEVQDYQRFNYKGQTLPLMKQADRAINWQKHNTEEILRRIKAADGSPGLLDEIYGQPVYLFNAHKAENLTGRAGEIIAIAEQAICRATIDGAIWIGHLQAKLASGKKAIKLPATVVLKDLLPKTRAGGFALTHWFSKTIKEISIDYTKPGRSLPCQEVWYELENNSAYLYFPFHNGAMSTEQCRLLLAVYRYIETLPVHAIVLMGGEENFSNGIHLNHIEAAQNPADESWLNICAIDDIVCQIINTMDKLVVAAIAGSAGAGGAILPLAADLVFAREGVIFNPHYKNMGELYGSEYWTYLLPKRVGQKMAITLTEQRLPISAKKAWQINLIDKVLDKQHDIFTAQIKHCVSSLVNDSASLQQRLQNKAKTRCYDESLKALAAYKKFELTQMYENFYGSSNYHNARKNFVYKQSDGAGTPDNIALHRQKNHSHQSHTSGSMYHFIWKDSYKIGDELVDKQHKDLFLLADKLSASTSKDELIVNFQSLYDHVEDHFNVEEKIMARIEFRNAKGHIKEHKVMLEKLADMQRNISNGNWTPSDIQDFLAIWSRHILHFDMAFNVYQQQTHQQNQLSVTE